MTNFNKGDIIVQDNAPELFAIYGGTEYFDEDGKSLTLTAYCDVSSDIFDIDIKENVDCGYVILQKNLKYWRQANEREIIRVIIFLAKKGYFYDSKTSNVRKINNGENIILKIGGKKVKIEGNYIKPVNVYNIVQKKYIVHTNTHKNRQLHLHCEEYALMKLKESMTSFVDKTPNKCQKK